ncbi:MAG: hypothetical protein Q7J80_14055 [Anaerolineales bacterium]|nr:hypothetical protein [Anaerolineales bacterium]
MNKRQFPFIGRPLLITIGRSRQEEERRLTSTRRVRGQIEDRLRLWLTEQNIMPKEYR